MLYRPDRWLLRRFSALAVGVLLVVFAIGTPSEAAIVYQHSFGTTTISGKPYTVAPDTLDANLSNSQWDTSASGFTSFSGSSGQALSLVNSSGTPTYTLTFTVAPGYKFFLGTFSFWRQRSSTGAQYFSVTINGMPVASGSVPTFGSNTDALTPSTPIENLTGTITVVLTFSGASGSGTVRLDDFTLNGIVDAAASTVAIDNTGTPAAGNISAGTSDAALFGFRLTPSAAVDFTGLSLTTAGTATASDLTNFRVVYDANNSGTYNAGDSVVSASAQSLANPITFAISGQTGFSAARRYLLIADVASGATAGHTFTASIPASSGVTTTGTESGTAAGNQQTIVAASCTSPTTSFAVTGGGAFCAGGTGVAVGLSGSHSGVTYQLYKDTIGTGQTVAGNGSAISFGNQTAAGTYTVWSTSAGGYCVEQMAGSPSSVTVSINALPTITLGSNPAVCQGITSASLAYSATTGSPDRYSIDFDGTAEGQGFADVTLATLASSPVAIAVPAGAAAGAYNGTLTVKNSTTGCVSAAQAITVTVQTFGVATTVFAETMGTVSGTTAIAAHESANGFDTDAFTMSGTADVRVTTPSSGYDGASGGANVFITTTSGTYFQIADINTAGLASPQLSFGVHKSTTASSGSDLVVELSSDGQTYTPLPVPALPTGSGTAIWHYRTASGTIPLVSNLRIRFVQNGTATQYRIDDVKLTDVLASAEITADGPTAFCAGGSVTLNASAGGSHHQWYQGASPVGTDSASYVVTGSGDYTVTITDAKGCTSTSPATTVTVNTPPTAANSDAGNVVGKKIELDVPKLLSRASGSGLSVTAVQTPTFMSGSASLVGSPATRISYTAPGTAGVDYFTYTITDVNGCTDTATIYVTNVVGGGQSPNIISTTPLPGGGFSFKFAGIPGFTYGIERAPSTSGPWTRVDSVTLDDLPLGDGIGVYDDTEASPPRPDPAYYRTVYP